PMYSFTTRERLLPGDLLRLGFEDDPGHRTVRMVKPLPKRGRFVIPPQQGFPPPAPGTEIFLVDRREPELMQRIKALRASLPKTPAEAPASGFQPAMPKPAPPAGRPGHVHVHDDFPRGKRPGTVGLWLTRKALETTPKTRLAEVWWWMPPVLWPGEQERMQRLLREALKRKARTFVLGAPWQTALFPADCGAQFMAGPFCNLANALAVQEMERLGFSGVFASPELPRDEMREFIRTSPLPVGVVLKGLWPLGISRRLAEELAPETPVFSPKGEICFARKKGGSVWIYPDRILDLTPHQAELEQAGASWMVHLHERLPKGLAKNARPSTFNWDLRLL
ncbi:MAG: U32 family peptidase, partial [Desulfovibrionaceae bacterium]